MLVRKVKFVGSNPGVRKNFSSQNLSQRELVQLSCTGLSTFFKTQSELIEPISPQAAQLGIHFLILYFFHNTQLEMHLLRGT